MFPLYDFLIYCFICAYTPGANNLLSMSNAARLGFRRSVVFNLGITAGFFSGHEHLYIFQCYPVHTPSQGKNLYGNIGRCVYALSGLESLEKFRRSKGGRRQGSQLLGWNVPPVYEPQDLHLRHYRHVSLHSAGVFFSPGPVRLCSGTDCHRRLRILCMGSVRRSLLPVLRPAYKGCKPGDGSAPGVLCSVPVSVDPAAYRSAFLKHRLVILILPGSVPGFPAFLF